MSDDYNLTAAVEAAQWTGSTNLGAEDGFFGTINTAGLLRFRQDVVDGHKITVMVIKQRAGEFVVKANDYVALGPDGQYYHYTPTEFEVTFVQV